MYKIAIFTPYNIFKHGGVQEHVNSQASILRRRGHDVKIITPRPRQSLITDAPEGVIFMGVSARIKAPQATSADISVAIDNDALDQVLAEDYDIVHVHEPLVPIAARQILSRYEGRALRVGTFHAALPGNRLGKSLVTTFKTYARSVLPHVDVITAVSPAAIGFIENYTEMPINYIPNGIDLLRYAPRAQKRDQKMVLFIGRLEKRKGPRQAIDALVELKKHIPDARLIIAGDGPMKKSLKEYVADNEIKGVEFLGFIDDDMKLQLLSTCGVYTSPALYGESFGIVLVEAMAMQAPVVCHINEGYRWVMQDSGRLSLVDCNDPVAYAERLQLLMEDNDLRSLWQKWAHSHVQSFDNERVVDAYEALYKQYLKR